MKLPVLRYEPDGYEMSGSRIMGRQSAGDAFLRAALEAADGDFVVGFGPSPKSAKRFDQHLRELKPEAKAGWLFPNQVTQLKAIGGIHFPDPGFVEQAHSRLRFGSNSYSLSGITHTLSSQAATRHILDYVTAPVMPWDGLICTSEAVKKTVINLLDAHETYLSWRFSKPSFPKRLQLPVIPLGVHLDDFTFSDKTKKAARKELQIGTKDIVCLFVGRLSFHAKAHPFPMYHALEEIAKEAKQAITLIQCGWFANEKIEEAFKQGAKQFAPHVNCIWLDGRKLQDRQLAWASSDVFISLPDNIQETFGLTPIEAMASGLPVVVSDWNGYKDTVEHGVNGFRIPTSMPIPPLGSGYAEDYWNGIATYDSYIGNTAQHISVDMNSLINSLRTLITDKSVRLRFGDAGHQLAQSRFDWRLIMKSYVEFWKELEAIRQVEAENSIYAKPQLSPERRDPFAIYAHYPTLPMSPETQIRRTQTDLLWSKLIDHPLLLVTKNRSLRDDDIKQILSHLNDEWIEIRTIAEQLKSPVGNLILLVSILVKFHFIEVKYPEFNTR